MTDKIMKLNIACGNEYMEGWINHDISDESIYAKKIRVDKTFDLNEYPWDFEDNTFDEIQAKAIIEHLPDRTKIWDELRRISKDGCKIHVEVPHFSGYTGYDDPTHYNVYSSETGNMVAWMWGFRIVKNEIIFSRINPILKYFNPLVNIFPRFYERFFANIFPSQLCFWDFEVIKNNDAWKSRDLCDVDKR